MSSKNEDHSTTGNVHNIVEMSFTQMEGQCYKCGAKVHLSNTCTKNVTKGQWYMDKMKMEDAQLTQASGDTMSTVNRWSSVTGNTPATNSTHIQGTASQEPNRPSWQGLQVHKSGTIHTHSYAQTNKHMYDWILLDTCSSINLSCNQSFVCNMHQVNSTLSLATNARMMMTNLKAELPIYGTVWFGSQVMTNVLSFGNIAKQCPI